MGFLVFIFMEKILNPILVKGSCNEALVYAKGIEQGCEDQLLSYLNQEIFAGTKVRIMPDMHPGKGSIVGFTATCNEYAVPSIIGVDIGCGICAYKLGKGKLPFDKLDNFIHKHIPVGVDVRECMEDRVERVYALTNAEMPFTDFKGAIREVCGRQEQNIQRVLASLGTLGGGNHFIEIDLDEEHNRWLIIHSGSRNFGLCIAEYHNAVAISKTKSEMPIKYLSNEDAQSYYCDMKVAQKYAELNRMLMAMIIIEDFFKEDFKSIEKIETVHNYIDFKEGIVRKGAVSAQKGERLIIPFSMSEGAVIGNGLGNPDWNYSAPHGAGRLMSRASAFKTLTMEDFEKAMNGIYSTSVKKETIDESPMAYKSIDDIITNIEPTAKILKIIKPVYNYKATEEIKKWKQEK